MNQNCNSAHNKKIELTTKAEPIFGEFEGFRRLLFQLI